MEQTLEFEIGRDVAKMQEKSFSVSQGSQGFVLDVRLPERYSYMAFLVITDPDGKLRAQKMLGYGGQVIGIGSSPERTSVGGVPGKIQAGVWRLGIGVFTKAVARYFPDHKKTTFAVQVYEGACAEAPEITEPIGEEAWVDGELRILERLYDRERIRNGAARWYKGDFHTHTRLSDGKETVASAMKKAAGMGMDFYVPTEHNLMHTGWRRTEILILPGMEVTTDQGHMNLFGITRPPEKLAEIMAAEEGPEAERLMAEIISEAKREGWIVSINHPFLTEWKWRYRNTDMAEIDCMEIINDPTYTYARESNDRAIRCLDCLWNDGYRICGVGGSDSHNLIQERYENATLPSVAGDPATWVYCRGLSPENLMGAVRAGHTCVSRFCRITPTLTASGESLLPGDEIPEDAEELTMELCLDQIAGEAELDEKPAVWAVHNGEYERIPDGEILEEEGALESPEILESPQGNRRYRIRKQYRLPGSGWHWYRLEVRNGRGEFLGFVNPVYRGRKAPEKHGFGAFAEMERE